MEISSTRPVSSVRMRLFTALNKFEMTFIGFDFLSAHKIPYRRRKSKHELPSIWHDCFIFLKSSTGNQLFTKSFRFTLP